MKNKIATLRGHVGLLELDGEVSDKWSFELFLKFPDEDEINLAEAIGINPPVFESEKLAHEGLQTSIRVCVEGFLKSRNLKPEDIEVLDSKTQSAPNPKIWSNFH